jgi:hypothetical protein
MPLPDSAHACDQMNLPCLKAFEEKGWGGSFFQKLPPQKRVPLHKSGGMGSCSPAAYSCAGRRSRSMPKQTATIK